jgi:HEPN domain-containing protein
MALDPVVAGYLASVEEELSAARLLANAGHRLAADHLQQGAEKLVKAVLAYRGISPTTEHRIETLVERLPASEPLRAVLAPLELFTPYATTFRYPTPTGRLKLGPGAEELATGLVLLETALGEVRKSLV